ncbi:uncharacterized protein LOC132609375 isoform X4 [Lycium barbarum]|uniref:uncharacterized protein LOC132609375 isoform X4 n=2 Tax=Lycium barbarum TaxID=112863 RepID=UPI00293F3653|nr:uncharacterized protein LOC132609375 isoform X4 [Lycium barbarum]
MLVLLEDVMVPIIALFDGFRIVKMEGVDKLLPFIVNQVSLQSLLCSLFCGLRSLRVWILLYSFVYIFRVLKAGGTVVLVIISQSAKVVNAYLSASYCWQDHWIYSCLNLASLFWLVISPMCQVDRKVSLIQTHRS